MTICTACGEDKPDSDFYKFKYKPNGGYVLHQSRRCKACLIEASRKWRDENPSKYKEMSKRNNARKMDQIKENMMRWYYDPANHERVKARMREYAKRCALARKARKNKS